MIVCTMTTTDARLYHKPIGYAVQMFFRNIRLTTPKKAHVYGKPTVDDDADSYLWFDPDKHLVIKCEVCGGYLFPGDNTESADLCYDSIGKIPFFDTRGIMPKKWSDSLQDDEDTYD